MSELFIYSDDDDNDAADDDDDDLHVLLDCIRNVRFLFVAMLSCSALHGIVPVLIRNSKTPVIIET